EGRRMTAAVTQCARVLRIAAGLLLCTAAVQAQTPPAGAAAAATGATSAQGALPAPPAGAPAASTGARFLEACNLSLQKGVTDLGCQGPLYRNELQRLQREALATQNPQLLSLVGVAYG